METSKMHEEINITFKTPKGLDVSKEYKESIGLCITFPEGASEIGYFLEKCLEDGFRENGATAVIERRQMKRIYV
jgi:hypothetical protein